MEGEPCRKVEVGHKTEGIAYGVGCIDIDAGLQQKIKAIMDSRGYNAHQGKTEKLATGKHRWDGFGG